MKRIALLIGALLAGLLAIPAAPQVASADSGCPSAAGSYAAGAGTAASPWQISTGAQLQRLRDDSVTGWDDSFILTASINMAGCTWTKTIGNNTTAFTGLLDGGGFTISGLTISVGETMSNAYAGLVGRLGSPGKVTRVGFTGDVSSSATTGSSKSAYAGGLVGYAQVGSTVSYSYATGAVTAYVDLGSMMSSAYGYAGGLIGRLDGTVSDSYATGSASATGGTGERYMYAGGLIGYSTASASRTYSTGAPTAGAGFVSQAGGFVGQTNGGTLTNSLWDVTSSGKSNGAGPNTPAGLAGKTTTQMQQFATYDDSTWPIVNGWQTFDIGQSKVWGICSGSTRAFLLWQYAASPCATSPGAPTITSVTPAGTTASVAFTADDTGGAALTRLEFALDDTATVDDSTATITSPYTLSNLAPGTTYVLFMRTVNSQGSGPWSAPQTFTTLRVPGAPTVTSVTPGLTSASVAFTADDSGGAAITRLEFALDDTTTVDDSTTNIASPYTLSGLASSTTYAVYMRAVNSQGAGPWSAATAFITLTPPPPPPPTPATAPVDIAARAGDGSVVATWQPPVSSGTYAVTQYKAVTTPGGHMCLTASTTCTITGLTNGVTYVVRVQALTGAGWSAESSPSNAVTPRSSTTATLTIAGSRGRGPERMTVRVKGTSTGLVGERVTMWFTYAGEAPTPSKSTAMIRPDGTFTWSRRANRDISLYAEAAGVRSNSVTIRAR